MEKEDFYFVPRSDAGVSDLDIITQHDNLIKNGRFTEAVALLDNNQFEKGVRASLIESIKTKLQNMQTYLLNDYTAIQYAHISETEPTDEEMGTKMFWVKPWN